MNSNNKQIAKKPSIEYEENDCRTNQECLKQTSFTNTELVEQKKIKFISKNEEKITSKMSTDFLSIVIIYFLKPGLFFIN